MRARAIRALVGTGYRIGQNPAIEALADWAAQNPGLDPRNYFSDWRDHDGQKAFRSEAKAITKDWRDFVSALAEAGAIGVTDSEVISEAPNAYSGQLTWTGTDWDYTPGQCWPTEYRVAARVLLEHATRTKRRNLPPTTHICTTMAEVKALNKANGGCWFDRASMRFFGTRIESGVIRGRYFITSEQPPTGRRSYSVRKFDDTGDVDTVGEFCEYRSKADAMIAIRALAD